MPKRTTVYVVTISEQFPYHGNDFEIEVFSTMDKAIAWIEEQISLLVKQGNLSPDAVDGWFVQLQDVTHTIQYNVHEREAL